MAEQTGGGKKAAQSGGKEQIAQNGKRSKPKARMVIVLCACAVLFVLACFFAKPVTRYFVKKNMDKTASVNTCGACSEESVTLAKGDYVTFGTYLGEPILWQVLRTESDGRVLLFSKYILTFKAYDASGKDAAAHNGADYEQFGSPGFSQSTLCQWLNSTEQHVSYTQCAPDKEHVYEGNNAYDGEPGFLSADNFSQGDLDSISNDGVFLLSKKQISSWVSTSDRVKTCTAQAALQDNSHYLVTGGQAKWYWTSSPIGQNRCSVTTVTSSGGFYKSLPYDGETGVAPALWMKSGKTVSHGGNGSQTSPFEIGSDGT